MRIPKSVVWGLAWLANGALSASDFSAVQKVLDIPLSIATVVDSSLVSDPSSFPDYILIQDIHRHPEAQENIRAMILHGLKHWGVQDIFLEGAWDAGQTQDFSFLGLENEDLYRKNVAAYEAVAQVQEDALRELETARLFGNVFDSSRGPSWITLKRLIQLRLKPAEYAEYMKAPFHPAIASSLAKAIASAENFYEMANTRSRMFLENAQARHRRGPEVLVVGGFHTAAMAKELRKKGISYVVLSPHITQGGFDGLYAQGMRETVSALKLH